MIVHIPQNPEATTGKGRFFNRLAVAMRELGATVVSGDAEHDVCIHPVKWRHTCGMKRILRLDGVYNDTAGPWKEMNKPISDAMHSAHGVVYQSEFSRGMCDRYLGKYNGPSVVIHNGAPLWDPPTLNKNCILAVARERPHKRHADIEKAAHKAGVPVQIFNGDGTEQDIRKAMAHAHCLVHLCWQDNCPNAVVEAIAAGLPVVCNNVCGTQEVVRMAGGIVAPIDPPYGLEPTRLYNPPPVDHDAVASIIRHVVEDPPEIRRWPVDIRLVAVQYLQFCQDVCGV